MRLDLLLQGHGAFQIKAGLCWHRLWLEECCLSKGEQNVKTGWALINDAGEPEKGCVPRKRFSTRTLGKGRQRERN